VEKDVLARQTCIVQKDQKVSVFPFPVKYIPTVYICTTRMVNVSYSLFSSPKNKKKTNKSQGCSSVVEISIFEALGSIPTTTRITKTNKQKNPTKL
jgi:hypothetical protein